MDRRWSEHALDRLAHAGFRRGGARRAVVECLDAGSCAVSAQDIDERLRAQGRPVGRASVYRALEQLAGLGLVQRIEVGDVTRYEPAHPGGEHHHHMVCDGCGAVVPFEDEALEHALHRVAGRVEFAVEGHDVILRGRCAVCR